MRKDALKTMVKGFSGKSDIRSGRRKRAAQTLGKNNAEPMRAGYSWREGGRIQLEALRGFLKKNLGRKWDEVYSEISCEVDKRSKAGHIFYEFLEYVVALSSHYGEDGELYIHTSIGPSRPLLREFYVDPEGYLRVVTVKARRRAEPDQRTKIEIEPQKEYLKLGGIWYYVEWKWQDSVELSERGKILEEEGRWLHNFNLHSPNFLKRYWRCSRYKVWTYKRQLNKKELKRLGLTNE